MVDFTEVLCVSDLRHTHKDIPTSLDTALKYTDGAKLGVGSCLVSVVGGYIRTLDGEIQYGNKRYAVDEYVESLIPYCYSDGAGGVGYVSGQEIPCLWDDPISPIPQRIPEGYYANYWLYAVLSADIVYNTPEEIGTANLFIVLGNTLYLTEREAKSEIIPLTQVLPASGVIPDFENVGNIVPFARVTIGVTVWGDGPIYTTSISQPMAFGFDVPPRVELSDIPDLGTLIEIENNVVLTETSRNRTYIISHYVEEGVNSTFVSLPPAATFGSGYWIRIINMSEYSMAGEGLVLSGDGEGLITWPFKSNATYLWTQQPFSSIRLVSTGMSGWMAVDFSGLWMDNSDNIRLFDGYVAGGTEDNVVTLDSFGNIKDSGVAISESGGEWSGAYDTVYESATIDLLDEEEFTLEETVAYTTGGIGYLLEVTPTTATGQISVEIFDDVAKTRLLCTHVIDLEAPTLRSSVSFGFEAETEGVLYCTLYCSGVPDSQTATFSLLAVIASPRGEPTPVATPYGDGLEDDGFGLPRIALSSTGGLDFDTGNLVVKSDVTADVQVVSSADGLSVSGAVDDSTDQSISAKKLFDSVGCIPLEASGYPTAGTYQLGAEILDLNNVKWRCTVKGTPGVWELADAIINVPLILVSTSVEVGTTYLFEIPVTGNTGFLQRLRIWAKLSIGTTDSEIPFRARIYETSSEYGREVIWQGMGIARQTALTVELPASQTYLEVASNDIIEVDEGIVIYEDDNRYEFGRCSGRTTGYINISESLIDASAWAVGSLVLPVSEWNMVPWFNLDGDPAKKERVFLQVRHDGIATDVDLTFYVQIKACCMSSITVVEEEEPEA